MRLHILTWVGLTPLLPFQVTTSSHANRTLDPYRDAGRNLYLAPQPAHLSTPSYLHSLLCKRFIPTRIYRWPGGWTMILQAGPAILPVERGTRLLTEFYGSAIAIAAAKMLSNTPPGRSMISFENRVFTLDYAMVDGGPTNVDMEWEVVYWFAAYMQALVRLGYTQIGRVVWSHESGIVISIVLDLVVPVRVRGGSGNGS